MSQRIYQKENLLSNDTQNKYINVYIREYTCDGNIKSSRSVTCNTLLNIDAIFINVNNDGDDDIQSHYLLHAAHEALRQFSVSMSVCRLMIPVVC